MINNNNNTYRVFHSKLLYSSKQSCTKVQVVFEISYSGLFVVFSVILFFSFRMMFLLGEEKIYIY